MEVCHKVGTFLNFCNSLITWAVENDWGGVVQSHSYSTLEMSCIS